MHNESKRWKLGCTLLLIVSLPALLSYGSTCDQAVQYKDGLLSVQSNGCSLDQLLKALQTKAGIEADVPPSAARVPVVANIEPGQPADVITALLSTTKFNYYLVGGEQNTVARVVISEVSAPPVTAVAAAPAPKPQAVAPAPAATTTTAKKKTDKKKSDKDKEVARNEVINTDDGGTPKPEVDESTLRNLPALPPGLPAALWRMYPEIVQNGGMVPDAPLTMSNGNPLPAQAANAAANGNPYFFQDPPPLPKGVVGLPQLPPDINPAMGKIYPYNLMQTINGPITYPNIVLPPMAPPIGVAPHP